MRQFFFRISFIHANNVQQTPPSSVAIFSYLLSPRCHKTWEEEVQSQHKINCSTVQRSDGSKEVRGHTGNRSMQWLMFYRLATISNQQEMESRFAINNNNFRSRLILMIRTTQNCCPIRNGKGMQFRIRE